MAGEIPVGEALLGRNVVVDTNGQFVYIGRLKRADEYFFELEDVDVHDGADSNTPNEIYIMDARKYGVKKNRGRVFVLARHVVSLSPLDEVTEY